MKIEQIIIERRTIHNFKNTRVPESVVARALELALWAPNHRMTSPWRFTLIGPAAREKLADLSAQLKSPGQPLAEEARAAIRQDFLCASHLVAIGLKRSGNPAQEREDYASVAAGLQNAALYLWECGVGCKWTTGKVTHHEQTYQILGVDAPSEEIVGFLWIGYADRVPPAAQRPALENVLRRTL